MSLVKLSVNRISYSQSQNGAYALILEEIEGERKLPIVIGGFEAQSPRAEGASAKKAFHNLAPHTVP